MSSAYDRTLGRLPHTKGQLARGSIGLLVGGAVASLTGLIASLLSAPDWVTVGLGALVAVSLAVAVVAPVWYWIVEPVFRDGNASTDDSAEES